MNKILIPIILLILGISIISYGIYSFSSTGYFSYNQKIPDEQTQNESVQEIIREPVQEEVKPNKTVELRCPDSCDDRDPCTRESCSKETNYACEYVAVAPCCGNEICESSESCSSCSIDCGNCQPETVQQPVTSNQTSTQNETQTQSALNHIIINEIQIADNEFVELYNPTDNNIDISNWYFSYFSSARDWSNPYRNKKFPDTATINSKGYYLIGLKGMSNADWQPYASAQLSNTDGSVAIFPFDPTNKTVEEAKSGRIDAVGWGNPQFVYEGSPAIAPENGKSLQRKSLNTDTDNNQEDLTITDNPTPQKST